MNGFEELIDFKILIFQELTLIFFLNVVSPGALEVLFGYLTLMGLDMTPSVNSHVMSVTNDLLVFCGFIRGNENELDGFEVLMNLDVQTVVFHGVMIEPGVLFDDGILSSKFLVTHLLELVHDPLVSDLSHQINVHINQLDVPVG